MTVSIAAPVLEILRCPRCKGTLVAEPAVPALTCAACALRYPIRGDIPILMVDQATPR